MRRQFRGPLAEANVLIAYLFRERGRTEIARRVLRECVVKKPYP